MTETLPLHRLLHTGRAENYPVALRNQQQLCFSEFSREAASWYHAFASHSGSRFALYFEDSADFSAALLGAWHAGKCVYLPSDMQPATLNRLKNQVDGFAGDIPEESVLIPKKIDGIPIWNELDPHAQGLVIYTSGSTGEPSAISKRLSQVFSEVSALASHFESSIHNATVLATVSHQHIYGLLFRILWPLASGRPFMAGRLNYPEQIAAAIAGAQSCVLIASPAHLKRLPEQLPWPRDSKRLVCTFSSGGPLPEDALFACRSLLGQAPIEIYGSSETGGIAWRQRVQDTDTAWSVLPGVEVKVSHNRLQVRSPHLSDSEWQTTGDYVQITSNGFELSGRADRIVKIEEKRISLTAIERTLMLTGLLVEVRAIAVTMFTDRRLALAVAAVPNQQGWHLYDESGKAGLSSVLRAALLKEVEHSALPRRWRYHDTLPVNNQGKTSEAALVALFDPKRPHSRLLERELDSALLRLEILPTLPQFDGHFPQTPILPGVAQIDWAIMFGREMFFLPQQFLRMENIKFQQIISPDSSVMLELHLKSSPATASSGEEASLSFKFTSDAGQHASGRIVFQYAASSNLAQEITQQ